MVSLIRMNGVAGMNMDDIARPRRLSFDKLSSRQRELELERKIQNRDSGDPELPPEPEAGDKYIVIGAFLGVLAGGGLGALVGWMLNGFPGAVIGALAGVIAGGIIGVRIGNSVKNRRRKEGPFGPGNPPDYE
jgi:predicted lipid-binding transport protein (Tim44 family)